MRSRRKLIPPEGNTFSISSKMITMLARFERNRCAKRKEATNADVRYTAFGTRLNWQFDYQVSIDGGVSRTGQRTVGGAAVARANEVFVAMAYRWDPLTMFR
jgi:hypothetical protein